MIMVSYDRAPWVLEKLILKSVGGPTLGGGSGGFKKKKKTNLLIMTHFEVWVGGVGLTP